jgi:hypothetical protein
MNDFPEGRSVFFRPAFDKRHPDPHQNYGVHGVEIVFVLRRGQRAVDWTVFTNWQLPHVTKDTLQKYADDPERIELFTQPSGAQVGFHSPVPMWDSHEPSEGCTITGGKCYSDVGFCMGSELMPLLIEKGEDAIWARLEELLNEMPEWKAQSTPPAQAAGNPQMFTEKENV